MKKNALLTIILLIWSLFAKCQILNYNPNFPDSSNNYLFLTRAGALKALEYKSELFVCKTDLSITEQILTISRRQANDYSNRLDSLTSSTAQSRIENKELKAINIMLTKKKNASKLENWAWRIVAVVTGYLIFKK